MKSRTIAPMIEPIQPAVCCSASQQCRRQEAADERAGDAEQNRHDPATRITARHEELRDRADDQTKQNPSDECSCAFLQILSGAALRRTDGTVEQQVCQSRAQRAVAQSADEQSDLCRSRTSAAPHSALCALISSARNETHRHPHRRRRLSRAQRGHPRGRAHAHPRLRPRGRRHPARIRGAAHEVDRPADARDASAASCRRAARCCARRTAAIRSSIPADGGGCEDRSAEVRREHPRARHRRHHRHRRRRHAQDRAASLRRGHPDGRGAEDDRQRPRRHRLHLRLPDRRRRRHRRRRPPAHHRREPRPRDDPRGDGAQRGMDRALLRHRRRRGHHPASRRSRTSRGRSST